MKIDKVHVCIILFALFIIGATYHFERDNYNVRNSPQMYCYSHIRGTLNPAFLVKSESQIDKLLLFYKEVEDTTVKAYLSSDAVILPQFDPVYVLRYLRDSTIAEVYSYYKYGKIYNGNTRGFVTVKTLHAAPPSAPINIEE